MVEMEVATEKAFEIIDIFTWNEEKKLNRLVTYLVFIVMPLLLIISMQLGALIIYLFNSSLGSMGHSGYARSVFLECGADGVFTSLPIKFIIKT